MYINSKIKDEGQYFFQCMEDGCPTVVDEPTIAKLVDQSCYERYVYPDPIAPMTTLYPR